MSLFSSQLIKSGTKVTNFDKKVKKRFSTFRTTQEKETLSKHFDEMDHANVPPCLLMEAMCSSTKCMVLSRCSIPSPVSQLLHISALSS